METIHTNRIEREILSKKVYYNKSHTQTHQKIRPFEGRNTKFDVNRIRTDIITNFTGLGDEFFTKIMPKLVVHSLNTSKIHSFLFISITFISILRLKFAKKISIMLSIPPS